MPYLLTGISLFIALVLHWRLSNSFWKATFNSTALILLISLLAIFLFPETILGLENSDVEKPSLIGIFTLFGSVIAFYGFIISMLVGYLLKISRQKN